MVTSGGYAPPPFAVTRAPNQDPSPAVERLQLLQHVSVPPPPLTFVLLVSLSGARRLLLSTGDRTEDDLI
jgi:hypothetical protein